MATTKAEVRKLEDGAYELGAELEGVFVPFVRKEAEHVAATVQSAKAAEQRRHEEDANS